MHKSFSVNIAEAANSGAVLQAGIARQEISNREDAVPIADPLYVTVLALAQGDTRALIIGMDVTAIGGRAISDYMLPDVGEEFLPALRQKIETELGLPGEHVLVNASHTHPPGRILCSDEEQIERCFAAAKQALGQLQAVRVAAFSRKAAGISMNRTLRLKDGQDWSIRHSIPSPPPKLVCGAGPLDDIVSGIRFERLDGSPLALLFNFACHLLFGNYDGALTANFPGLAARRIEAGLGQGCMALFLQGAAGDVCDVEFKNFSKPRDIAGLADKLAAAVLAEQAALRCKNANLSLHSEEIMLPRRKDIPQRLQKLQQQQVELLSSLRFCTLNFDEFWPLYQESLQAPANADPEHMAMRSFNQKNIDRYIECLRSMEQLSKIEDDMETLRKHAEISERVAGAPLAGDVMGLRIGDSLIITAPFEALAQISLDVKAWSAVPNTMMAAYSNGYMHYGAPASYYERGGYEVCECQLDAEWQQIYENCVKKIIAKLS